MNEIKLKPCPFCGGESIEIVRYCDGPIAYYYALCNNCFSSGGSDCMKEKAAENWNKRAVHLGRWKEVEGDYITPGGTPVYECAQCGGGQHLHGVEYPEQALVCPKCGSINLYPWEKVRWLEDE